LGRERGDWSGWDDRGAGDGVVGERADSRAGLGRVGRWVVEGLCEVGLGWREDGCGRQPVQFPELVGRRDSTTKGLS
jgi:hypothetical protein